MAGSPGEPGKSRGYPGMAGAGREVRKRTGKDGGGRGWLGVAEVAGRGYGRTGEAKTTYG